MIITVFSSKTLVSFRLWLYRVWCIWLWPTYLLGFDLCRFGFNACLFGFDSCLFRFNSCLFDFDSNICFRLYLPVSGDCPKLQSIPLARPSYRWCTTESQAVNHTCIFVCATGYSLEGNPKRMSFQFVCQANWTWSGKRYKCVGKSAPK